MLKEIKCEQFAQPVILLHPGLNVIAGDENASNSIGKSSALLAIEYAFGGSTYAKQDDIIKNVKHHDICFCHVFDGVEYYFKRNTSTPNTIYECDNVYNTLREQPLDVFFSFLLAHYHIDHCSLSFRDFVGLFSRIYGKNNLDEKNPLNIIGNEAGNKSITRLLKIMDEYERLEQQKKAKEDADNRLKTFKAAQGMRLVSPRLSKKDKKEREAEILTCTTAIDSITTQLSSLSVNLDSQQLEAISLQKKQQRIIESLLSRQKYKLYRLQRSLQTSSETCTVDTTQLALFFPTINIAEVDKINEFHGRLSGILKTKIIAEIKDCQEKIGEYNKQVTAINNQITRILNCTNPAKLAVDNLIKIKADKDRLEKEIEESDKYTQYDNDKKAATETYKTMVLKVLTGVQQTLNNELSRLCEIVSPKKNPPQFALKDSGYEFFIHNDTGAGSKYKSTILTDLGFMNITDLPFVMHDTVLFKNIEDDTMENILVQYALYEQKQVFIAFDHINSFTKVAIDILRSNTVLNLSTGGRELFGKSWNTK